jgi:squalene-hopene/tetraprenyl-beta-curcumene cyclase
MRISAMILLFGVITLNAAEVSTTQPEQAKPVSKDILRQKMAEPIRKGLSFLVDAQLEDGGWPGWTGASDPAITALVTKAFIQHPDYGPKHPVVQQAVKLVLSYRQPDGGIYDPKIGYANYTTSIALMMLSSLEYSDFSEVRDEAVAYLKKNQWTPEDEDNHGKAITREHPWYGGAGYGKHRRPDLSNTQMMLEALHQSGLPADDPAFQRAMQFVRRCQMLSSTNDLPLAKGAIDGGFIYSPANGGESKAGFHTVGGITMLRSYGSMTYAGFKSMLYADVDRNDRRVQAAWNWIRSNYTLEHNPGLPAARSKQGLYYYYHVFAKALQVWGKTFVTEPNGQRHDWRRELCEELREKQRPDGSWINTADRWMEDNPCLVTAYSLLAIQAALE